MFATSKAGRDAAFTAFVGQASPGLMRTAWALTGSSEAAQELVQAALVKTYAAWPRIRQGEALAYARRILVNHRIDVWRSTRAEVVVDDVPERLVPAGDTAYEQRDRLVRLLGTLPEQQRRVVVLRYYNDLPEREVAELLGISIGAVKSAASRGLAALRDRDQDLTTKEAAR